MSNLLKDASILLTPTAYENGRMNAIKPYKDLYGPELVTNGDFSNGSTGWTISGSASVGVNKLNVNAGAFDFFATQVALTNGLKCKVTIDAEVTSGDILLYTGTQFATISSSGSYTFYTTSDSSQIRFRSGGSGFVGSITNVSVKEDLSGDFQFSRNSAATRVNAQGLVENVQIISSELVSNGNFSQIGTEEVSNGNFSQEGSEQVTNGDFATDTKWTTNTGWTISGGSANCDGTQSGNTTLVQQGGIKGATINFVVGKTYKVNFDIVVTSGWISNIEVASGYDSNAITTSGNHTTYITAVSTNNRFTITANPDFIGSIDNVSVKEVGQDWNLGTGWSIGDDKVEADGTSAFLIQGEFQSVASVKSYKIQYEVISTNGVNIRFGGGSSMFGTPTLDTSTIGIKTIYLTSNGTVRNLQFQNNLGFIGSITNISVKEVGQDWTFGSGWSVDQANSKATCDGTQTSTSTLQTAQGISNIQNDLVKLSFEIKDYSAGAVSVTLQGTGGIEFNNLAANGVYEINVTSTDSLPRLLFNANSSFVGSVTNISVKEITDDTDLPRINYEGFSYQDSLGSEEVVNGDFSNGSANWTTENTWTIENGVANGNGANGSTEELVQVNVNTTGKTYKATFEVLNYVSGSVGFWKGSGIALTQRNANGTYTEYFTATSDQIRFRGINFIGSIDNVSVKEVLGQEVVPDSGCGSWLLEGQSTNLVIESEALSTMQTQSTITDNNLLSPTGDVNASLVVENTATNHHGIKKSNIIPTNANAVDYTISVFAKKKERQFVQFQLYAGSTQYNSSFFDLENGTTSGDASTHKIEDYGNGWYRCSFTDSVTQSTGGFNFAAAYMSQSSTSYYTGDGASGIYMFGFQLEEQSHSTSYIPTSGATNTRLQDIANNSGNSTLINSTEGVLYAEIAALSDDNTNRYITISDGSNSNYIRLVYSTTSNQLGARYYVNGSFQCALTYILADETEFIKAAFKWKENDFALWVNGTEVATDTSGNVNPENTFYRLDFSRYDGIFPFNGKTKALAVYKEALTDAELQSLTTI